MESDIAECDSVEEAMASLDRIERDIALHELLVDGYWDSVRPNSDPQGSRVV